MTVQITLVEFCEVIKPLEGTNAEKALAILWFRDRQQRDVRMSSGQLTKALVDHHLGTPNATQLAAAIRKTKLAAESSAGFSLKPGSRKIIQDRLPAGIDGIGLSAGFDNPYSITIDVLGNLYVPQASGYSYGGYRIRRITPSGVVTTMIVLANTRP